MDCIDLVSCKLDLIRPPSPGASHRLSLGTGNKLDPACSASPTFEARAAPGPGEQGLRARPPPPGPLVAGGARAALQREGRPPGRRSVPGSVAWVPPVAGLMLAGEVVLSLAGLHV
ncbi:MAG: hypothetical protein ACLUES_06490 [Flavonifractor plautii]